MAKRQKFVSTYPWDWLGMTTEQAEISAERAFATWVMRMRVALCIMDHAGHIVAANPAAQALVKRHATSLKFKNGRLGAAIAFAESSDRDRQRSLAVLKLRSGRPLLLLAEPLGPSLVAVRLWRPSTLALDNFAPLARHYGLSPQQARVAGAVITGRNVEQIASKLRIKQDTVRAHLKVVFARLGVSNQAGLIAAFVRCLGVL